MDWHALAGPLQGKPINERHNASEYILAVIANAHCPLCAISRELCPQLERGEVGNGTVTSMKESVGFVKQARSLYIFDNAENLDCKACALATGVGFHAYQDCQLACRIKGKSSCV